MAEFQPVDSPTKINNNGGELREKSGDGETSLSGLTTIKPKKWGLKKWRQLKNVSPSPLFSRSSPPLLLIFL
jgi:hypothetical protein